MRSMFITLSFARFFNSFMCCDLFTSRILLKNVNQIINQSIQSRFNRTSCRNFQKKTISLEIVNTSGIFSSFCFIISEIRVCALIALQFWKIYYIIQVEWKWQSGALEKTDNTLQNWRLSILIWFLILKNRGGAHRTHPLISRSINPIDVIWW